jgi:tetratricopeptide (TPR) repeat protein
MKPFTHSTNESRADGAAVVDCPSTTGVGVGCGPASPEVSTPPSARSVEVEAASAHTNAAISSKRLIDVPSLVHTSNSRGRVPATSPQFTPDCLSDKRQFDSLVMSGRFADAIQLCRERLLTGHDPVRWTKDRSIVSRSEGKYEESFDLLASVHSLAMQLSGVPRGKFENSFGRTHELLGKANDSPAHYDKALEYYTAARIHMEEGGDLIMCASVDTNTGRCHVAAKEPQASFLYFDRAARIAKQFNEGHLLGEIEESRALAFEAAGDYAKALDAVADSIGLLARTNDEVSLAESLRTRARIVGKVNAE